MLLLEQSITRKRRINENVTELAELDTGDNESGKYKMEIDCDSTVYTKESTSHLPGLYHLVFLKKLSKRKEYLEALFSGSTPYKTNQLVSQKLS